MMRMKMSVLGGMGRMVVVEKEGVVAVEKEVVAVAEKEVVEEVEKGVAEEEEKGVTEEEEISIGVPRLRGISRGRENKGDEDVVEAMVVTEDEAMDHPVNLVTMIDEVPIQAIDLHLTMIVLKPNLRMEMDTHSRWIIGSQELVCV